MNRPAKMVSQHRQTLIPAMLLEALPEDSLSIRLAVRGAGGRGKSRDGLKSSGGIKQERPIVLRTLWNLLRSPGEAVDHIPAVLVTRSTNHLSELRGATADR